MPKNLPSEIEFLGPYALVPKQSNVEYFFDGDHANRSGVYLWTIGPDTHTPYYIGISNQSIIERTREHLRCYLSGQYWVYDMTALQNLRRVSVHNPKTQTEDFLERSRDVYDKVIEMLESVRLFYCPLDLETKDLKRIETGLIRAYRQALESDFIENNRISINTPKESRIDISIISNGSLTNIVEMIDA